MPTLKNAVLPFLLLLAACNPSPEQAKKSLVESNIAQTPESLLASTKSQKSADVAKLLVTAGVDVNARQSNGMTALMSASFNRQIDVAKALLEKGADVSAAAAGFNALSLAVDHGDIEMSRLLIEHGADPATRPDGGMSALERAQQRSNKEMIELLQSKKTNQE